MYVALLRKIQCWWNSAGQVVSLENMDSTLCLNYINQYLQLLASTVALNIFLFCQQLKRSEVKYIIMKPFWLLWEK